MKIKRYREKLGLSQEEVANMLGITQQAYSYKELGQRGFKAKELLQLEKILKVSISEFMGDLGDN